MALCAHFLLLQTPAFTASWQQPLSPSSAEERPNQGTWLGCPALSSCQSSPQSPPTLPALGTHTGDKPDLSQAPLQPCRSTAHLGAPRISGQESCQGNHHPPAELPWASGKAAPCALPGMCWHSQRQELASSRVLTQNDHKMLMNEIRMARLFQHLPWFCFTWWGWKGTQEQTSLAQGTNFMVCFKLKNLPHSHFSWLCSCPFGLALCEGFACWGKSCSKSSCCTSNEINAGFLCILQSNKDRAHQSPFCSLEIKMPFSDIQHFSWN